MIQHLQSTPSSISRVNPVPTWPRTTFVDCQGTDLAEGENSSNHPTDDKNASLSNVGVHDRLQTASCMTRRSSMLGIKN